MTFRRHLSRPALDAARTLSPRLRALAQRPGGSVELRRSDTITAYLDGRRVTTFRFDGRAFGEDPAPPPRNRPPRDELTLQASWLDALVASGHWQVLDQQLAVPAAALSDPAFRRHRVDAVLMEARSGRVWLLEIKLATASDLDGPALAQTRKTAGLSQALRGGEAVFLEELAAIATQKRDLGLWPPGPTPRGPVGVVLAALGDPREARARIACWEAPPPRGDIRGVLSRPYTPASPLELQPLDRLHADALAGDRVPYAPRRPRWNDYTATVDAALERDPIPMWGAWMDAYLRRHDAPLHPHAKHPRSSQRACLVAFEPAAADHPGAREALAEALAPATPWDTLELEAIHFEAPHGNNCAGHGADACPVADMQALVGESGPLHTRLDVLLLASARRDDWQGRVAIGVEFKFTEPEFGSCGGFRSRGNKEPDRRACIEGPATTRAQRCYLHRKEHRRYLAPEVRAQWWQTDPLTADTPCPLLGPLNQLYRSQFVTAALAEHLGCDDYAFLVVAPEANQSLWSPERPLPGHPGQTLDPLERMRSLLAPHFAARLGRVGTAQLSSRDGSSAWITCSGRMAS